MPGEKLKLPEQKELPIVFVDTNILLDAYRSRNDVGLHLVERLDEVQNHLIILHTKLKWSSKRIGKQRSLNP
jgi:hypothetical protein